MKRKHSLVTFHLVNLLTFLVFPLSLRDPSGNDRARRSGQGMGVGPLHTNCEEKAVFIAMQRLYSAPHLTVYGTY